VGRRNAAASDFEFLPAHARLVICGGLSLRNGDERSDSTLTVRAHEALSAIGN
jgi:hypothetical protein